MNTHLHLLVFVTAFTASLTGMAQPAAIPLWLKGAPGSEGKPATELVKPAANGERIVSGIHNPSITPYFPAKGSNTGAAIIIAPGGGHYQLSIDSEGYNVGKWLSEHGITAFVLKYRLAKEAGSSYTVEGDEMADIQRAIRSVKSRAGAWGIDTARVGVLGFSAGGELAWRASMTEAAPATNPADAIDRESARTAFQALIYPGNSAKIVVSPKSAPAFIACGYGDRPDISRGMAELYLKLKHAGVPADLHIYAKSGHGFGYRPNDKKAEVNWLNQLLSWMNDMGFLTI